MLGVNSGLYALGSSALDLIATLRSDGFGVWRTLRRLSRAAPGDPVAVKLRRLDHPLWLRPGSDDPFTVLNNAVREEYGRLRAIESPRWMIDGGAHIGDTAAYFLSRFPGLRVIALEPSADNHALAERNLAAYGDRAILLNMALCADDRLAAIAGVGVAATLGGTGQAVRCTCVPTLLARYGIERIDILKLDIEGAEDEVLGAAASVWLGRVGLVLLETHGPEIESRVTRVLGDNGFALRRYRSLWYGRASSCAPGAQRGRP